MSRIPNAFFALFIAAIGLGCGDDVEKKDNSNQNVSNNTANNASYQHETCYDVAVCNSACETTSCLDACSAASEPEALDLYVDYVFCAEDNCAPDYGDGCIYNACEAACVADGGNEDKILPEFNPVVEDDTSTLTCSQLAACIGECETDACFEGCLNASSESAAQKYGILLDCVVECQDAGGTDCLDTDCSQPLQTCQLDS